jgi:spermidine synthase
MAMEVIWTRAFSPVLKTQVYSFALVVATYLGATFGGSLLYRWQLRKGGLRSTGELLGLLCVSAFLPVVLNDVRLVEALWWVAVPSLRSALILMGSLLPFCAVLGYLTPALVDEYAGGCPRRSGSAYALNVLGCILGPLFACYLLLPHVSERLASVLMGLLFAGFVWVCRKELSARKSLALGVTWGSVLFVSLFYSEPLEDSILRNTSPAVARRDYAASVLAFGSGMNKSLLVNGVGMTKLTPITKVMAHLPLGFHQGRPESALVICLGMGTSYRSALSWDIKTTAVELVPGVTESVGFFHTNAHEFLSNPKGHLVVDDGRRYLQRTQEKYDVIVVDPPPPLTAAGSSLLYSLEFYEVAKLRLNPGGIMQVWIPESQVTPTSRAMLRSVCEEFPHVRCFISAEKWGIHILASMEPLEACTAVQLAARMPERAKADLLEWDSKATAVGLIDQVLSQELKPEQMLDPNRLVCISDDQPFNEYFLLRSYGLY